MTNVTFLPAGRIAPTYHLVRKTQLAGDLSSVFAFFKDPRNLETITPPWLGFRITSTSDHVMRSGTRIRYRLSLHGIPMSWESRITEFVESLEPSVPILLAGDFNCWRPLLRALLPGWRSMVRARTWPARTPHSQIDHVLARGPWTSLGGFASDGGSDHRALVADVTLG